MNIHFSQKNRRWDSTFFPIDDNQFELTIQFRVRLVRIESTTHFTDGSTWAKGDGIVHDTSEYRNSQLHTWDDLEWETYKREFKSVLERNWQDKFVLLPNKAWYTPRTGSDKVSSLVKCSLTIQVVDFVDQHPHFTFRCIHPDTSFRSYIDPSKAVGVITHEDLIFSWIRRRTKIGGVQHRVEFGQITVLHEFGHVLGFDHINGASIGDSAYGVTLEQRETLMGMGHHFQDTQARPWVSTLNRHLIRENSYDRSVKFTGHINGLQIIAYWDNDFDLKSTPATPKHTPITGASSGVHHSADKDAAVKGPAGVTWEHMTNMPATD